jgi:DNA-binding Lrp family transcriptional regulator
MLLIRLDKGADPDEFASKLSKLPEICMCVRITGYYEIMATANCNHTSEVNNLLKKIREMGNVSEINTSLIISRHKITPIFL